MYLPRVNVTVQEGLPTGKHILYIFLFCIIYVISHRDGITFRKGTSYSVVFK